MKIEIGFGKDNDKRCRPKYISFDPRLPEDRVLAQNLEQLRINLARHAPNSCFFAFHDIPDSISDSVDSLPISVSEVPSLYYPFEGSNVELDNYEQGEDSLAFNYCYDISSPDFKEMMDLYCKGMPSMTQEEIDLIQSQTIGQCSNDKWLKHRLYRLTASNFYLAAVNRVVW